MIVYMNAPKPKKPDRLEIDADTGFKTRFFVVWLDHAGQAIQVDTGHIAAVTSEEAGDMLGGWLLCAYTIDRNRCRVI